MESACRTGGIVLINLKRVTICLNMEESTCSTLRCKERISSCYYLSMFYKKRIVQYYNMDEMRKLQEEKEIVLTHKKKNIYLQMPSISWFFYQVPLWPHWPTLYSHYYIVLFFSVNQFSYTYFVLTFFLPLCLPLSPFSLSLNER